MSTPVPPRFLFSNPLHMLAFGFGSGLSPHAPGTCGTVVAVLFMPWLEQLPLATYLVVLLVSMLAGVWICGVTSRHLGVHDHGGIVWDEFVGYWIGMLCAPNGWVWWLTGFALFRLFDIVKPWPIRWVDRHVHGGLGIMLDDVLAGVMTLAVIQVAAIVL